MSKNLGRESWSDFCARVAAATGTVSWRWAAVPQGEEDWGLVALVVETGRTTLLDPGVDRFQKAIIAVEELSAETASERLRAFVLGSVDAETEVGIPEQHAVVLQQVWADEEWASTRVGWPRLVAEAGAGSGAYADPSEALSAVGMRFYPSFGAAVAERVLCVAAERVHVNQLAPLSFHLTDCRGRIGALLADGEDMRIEIEEGVEGGLGGFSLRLAWRGEVGDAGWSRHDRPLSGAESILLQTGGVPAELFAAMVDPADAQVDQRAFDRRLHGEAVDPETPEASLARWVTEGEHGRLEYKQELKPGTEGNRSFAETVAAFANGAGGEILVGIGDDGGVIGWSPEKSLDRVTDIVSSLVKETPAFEVATVPIEDTPIVVVRVTPSPPHLRPHQVRGRVMIRVNATTREASPAELRDLIASDLVGTGMWAAPPPSSPFG